MKKPKTHFVRYMHGAVRRIGRGMSTPAYIQTFCGLRLDPSDCKLEGEPFCRRCEQYAIKDGALRPDWRTAKAVWA